MAEDSTLLPNRAGQRARQENRWRRIERAAWELSWAWDEWIKDESDAGFDLVAEKVGAMRAALGQRRGTRPWRVTWKALRFGGRRHHAAYKTRAAAERTVAELAERPDLWGDIQRRYPVENSRA